MSESLLCLNPEWQGCESPILKVGANRLAKELFGSQPFVEISVTDLCEMDRTEGVFALKAIAAHFVEALNQLRQRHPKRIVTVGGSCGTEAAPVTYLNEIYNGNMAVIWFDAHGDLNTPASSPSGHFHGMVLRTLLGNGPKSLIQHLRLPLMPRQVFLVGARDLDVAEQNYIDETNIFVARGEKALASEMLVNSIVSSGFEKIYIHVDVDVLNPTSFSDALMPTPGGPTLTELAECLYAVQNTFEVVGVGVVEYCGQHSSSSKQIGQLFQEGGIMPTPRAAGL